MNPGAPSLAIRALEGVDDLPRQLALYRHLHRADEPLPDGAVVESVWSSMPSMPSMPGLPVTDGFVGRALVASCVLTVLPHLTRGWRPDAWVVVQRR